MNCISFSRTCCMFAAMDTVAAIEQQFIDDLANLYHADEAKHLCFLVFEDRLGWSRQEYLLRKREPLDETAASGIQKMLRTLRASTPIQYLLGYTWFLGMKIAVNESVLIPRPETEELVDRIIQQHKKAPDKPLRIIDVGTGSGCIAIALKKALPNAVCYALEVSAEALKVARQNAAEQSVNLTFINADILEWDIVFQSNMSFDIIVSNPPYITSTERQDMHQNVLDHEPYLALFVTDSAPLLFYDHIAAFAQTHLVPGGNLYFEINRHYGQQVCELLRKKAFTDVQLYPDIHGADRVVQAQKAKDQPSTT